MPRHSLSLLSIVLGTGLSIILGSSCAHQPIRPREDLPLDAQKIWTQTCAIGTPIRPFRGELWIKVKSAKGSGQFPISVLGENPTSGVPKLTAEVTHFLGGTLARIHATGNQITLERPGRPPESNRESWQGLPLRWVTALFWGRVPCPGEGATADLSVVSTDPPKIRAIVETGLGTESYVYDFLWDGTSFWPTHLEWTRNSDPKQALQFQFETPEKDSRSPLRWTLSTQAEGETVISARWKDKEWVP